MNRQLFIFLYFSFLIVFTIVFINSFLINLKGAEVDAERFLHSANTWASSGALKLVIDAEFFIQFLGVFVHLFEFGEFELTLMGVFFYYWVYLKLLSNINFKVSKKTLTLYVLLILTLLSPSVLLRIGALLREPYVIFTMFFMVYYGAKYIESNQLKHLLYSFIFGLSGMFFHKALLAFMPIYFFFLAIFTLKINGKSILLLLTLLIFSTVVISAIFPAMSTLRGGTALSVVLSGDFSGAEQVVSYKSGREFRTTYDYGADFSNPLMVLVTLLKANYYYYMSPFPWNIRTVADIFAFLENISRIWVIIYLFSSIMHNKNKPAFFVLTCYLLINTIWAVGTSNYGTGSRHHITTLPLLLLSFVLITSLKFNKKAHNSCTQLSEYSIS